MSPITTRKDLNQFSKNTRLSAGVRWFKMNGRPRQDLNMCPFENVDDAMLGTIIHYYIVCGNPRYWHPRQTPSSLNRSDSLTRPYITKVSFKLIHTTIK